MYCSEKFHKIHRKIPVPESLFNKNLFKKEALAQVLSCEFCEISKNTFFREHLWTTAPDILAMNLPRLRQIRSKTLF